MFSFLRSRASSLGKWLLPGVCAAIGCAATATTIGLVPPLARPPAAAPSQLAAFDPDVVRPRAGSALEAALSARARGEREVARAVASAALATADARDEPLLRFVAAQAARSLDALDEASALLTPLALSSHPLASWAKLNLAEWVEGKDPARSLSLLDALLAPAAGLDGWPGRPQAERLRARVLGKLGRKDDALAELERLLAESADDGGALQVLMPLAELLAERDDAARVRAIGLYRRIAYRVGDSKLAKRAEEQANALLASLPATLSEELLAELTTPAFEDKLVRAEALLAGLHCKEAAAAFAEVENAGEASPELVCKARFGRARALLDNRARSEGAALMAEVASECDDDPDQRAWARYHAARAFCALGKNDLALEQYEALEREAPTHRLADDALYRAAKVAHDMGDEAGSNARLAEVPRRYPEGDMVVRARFGLAFQAAQQGDLATAISTLASDDRDERSEDLQGRAGYFRARYLAQAGRNAEAAEGFAQTFQRFPLSYYGRSAFSRLSELDPQRARALAPRLPQAPVDARGSAREQNLEKLTFDAGPELAQPGFARALALFSAGETSLAMSELRALGFLDPAHPAELTWLAAALLDRSGVPHLAVETARKRMPELLAQPPVGRRLALYRLVYPSAFSPLIEDSAAREGVPAAFVRAVAREESGFYPKAVSRARAYGLIQLLEPTARAISKSGLGLATHPAALQQPAINLALGSRFIANLAQGMGGQFALVPAAYNAGPAAAARWLEERAHEPLDMWIENIPYDETRTYSRRVLQTYGVYHWLETGELLQLPETLPQRVPPAEGVARAAPARESAREQSPEASLNPPTALRADL
jgi:soluble lytic murein transglycosylase